MCLRIVVTGIHTENDHCIRIVRGGRYDDLSRASFEMQSSFNTTPQCTGAFDNYICTKKELIVSSILKNLDQGIKEGLYREDLNKEIVAHLYFKKIEEFHTLEGEDLRDFSYSKVFEVMFENHIRGIANKNGIEYFEKQKAKLNFNLS